MPSKVNKQSFKRCYEETHPWIENKSQRADAEWIYLLSEFNLIGKGKNKWPQSFHDHARYLMNDWKNTFAKIKEKQESQTTHYRQKVAEMIDPFQPKSPIADNHIPFKYKYLSSSISLRTTDEAITKSLLTAEEYKYDKPVRIESFHQQNGKILAQLSNVLSSRQCNEIIGQCDDGDDKNNVNADTKRQKMKFQRMNKNKYDKRTRKSERLLIIDDNLSALLCERLLDVINKDIIQQYNVSCIPLGFGVLKYNEYDRPGNHGWNITKINNGMRINRYCNKSKDFFDCHKDAQFCNNPNERSLFTLIIYLNDDFKGGQTKFYFENAENKLDSNMINGLTMKEEIVENEGIDNGYDCITIKPTQCDAVLFSQSIMHCGCRILSNNTKIPKYKYILKTDIVVTRKPVNIGFAISSLESMDYKRCLNYFIEAQRNELQGNKSKSNQLYERSLSIRYSYPKKLIAMKMKETAEKKNDNDNSKKLYIEITEVWLIIFQYCHHREIALSVALFTEQLYDIYIKWKLRNNIVNDDINIGYHPSDAYLPFIPKVIKSYGAYTRLAFNDLKFFKQHRDQCLRVAAIYTLYLMSHRNNARFFVVQYDSITQNIMAIPLYKLLSDVFYGRQCNGKYFKIKSFQDDHTYINKDDGYPHEDGNYDPMYEHMKPSSIPTNLKKMFKQDIPRLYATKTQKKLKEIFGCRVNSKLFRAYKQVMALGINLDQYSASWKVIKQSKDIIDKQANYIRKFYDDYNENRLYEEFNAQIDRDYMTMTHGAQFVGGVGILSDKQFYFKCQKRAEAEVYNDMKHDWMKMHYYYKYKYPYQWEPGNGHSSSGYYAHQKNDWQYSKLVKEKILKTDNNPQLINFGTRQSSKQNQNENDYFRDITAENINIHKTRITKAWNEKCHKTYHVQLYNTLIFDFERKNMEIIEDSYNYNFGHDEVGLCDKYCFTWNPQCQYNIDELVGALNPTGNGRLSWTRTRYSAKVQLPLMYILKLTNAAEHNRANVIKDMVNRGGGLGRHSGCALRIISYDIDTQHRFVSFEITLIDDEYRGSKSNEDVIRCIRNSLGVACQGTYDRRSGFCQVETIETNVVDDEFKNLQIARKSIKYYVIGIKNLINNDGGYDLSYNHAAAHCGTCGASNTSWSDCSDYYNFKFQHYSGYSHMDHLHVVTMDDELNNKCLLWVSYNGVAAL